MSQKTPEKFSYLGQPQMIKRPRVCHFTYSFFPVIGGMEEMIHSISLAVLDKGWEPFVFTPWTKHNNSIECPYDVVRFRRLSSRRYLSQVLLTLLWRYLKSPFDVLHCHCVYPPGYIGTIFSKITGVPCVITTHGADIQLTAAGYVTNRKVTRRIRAALGAALAVTGSSAKVKERLIHLGANAEKIHIIHNGVFTNEFLLASDNEYTTDYILYLGRIHEIKDLDILINAFASLKNKNVRLKIAGEGEIETKKLVGLAKKLGIGDQVEFLGNVRGAQKVELLQKALFFVCPRIMNNLGLANLEALASGIPVITTRIEASEKVIIDGENGFLIKERDTIDLAAKMDLLINQKELRKSMAEKARATASLFDWNNLIIKYLHVYEKLINSKRRKSFSGAKLTTD